MELKIRPGYPICVHYIGSGNAHIAINCYKLRKPTDFSKRNPFFISILSHL
jgi:hypothetical protein